LLRNLFEVSFPTEVEQKYPGIDALLTPNVKEGRILVVLYFFKVKHLEADICYLFIYPIQGRKYSSDNHHKKYCAEPTSTKRTEQTEANPGTGTNTQHH
jgi:hypothetical protein